MQHYLLTHLRPLAAKHLPQLGCLLHLGDSLASRRLSHFQPVAALVLQGLHHLPNHIRPLADHLQPPGPPPRLGHHQPMAVWILQRLCQIIALGPQGGVRQYLGCPCKKCAGLGLNPIHKLEIRKVRNAQIPDSSALGRTCWPKKLNQRLG